MANRINYFILFFSRTKKVPTYGTIKKIRTHIVMLIIIQDIIQTKSAFMNIFQFKICPNTSAQYYLGFDIK